MNTFLVIVASCLAVALAVPYDLAEDVQGRQYYLIPVSRQKRGDPNIKFEDPGVFTASRPQGTAYLDNLGRHRLEGSGFDNKNFAQGNGPINAGGRVDYTHVPSGATNGVTAQHVGRARNKVGVEGTYNLYKNGPLFVDLKGDYSRRYEGKLGTSKPNWNVGINGGVNFP